MKAITYLLENTYISMQFLCTLISEMLFYYSRFVEILITYLNRQYKYKWLNNKYNTVLFETVECTIIYYMTTRLMLVICSYVYDCIFS